MDLMKNKGFTLIEVLVTIVILSVGLFAFNIMQVQTVKGNADGFVISELSWHATNTIEELSSKTYSSVAALDGTGTTDGAGGLDDGGPRETGSPYSATKPDVENDSDDGLYSIRYNIAENVPEDGIITIRVIVVRKSDGKNVVVEYLKSRLG